MVRILIADDEKDVLELSKTYFNLSGLDVDTASDGNEALDKIKRGNYSVVITDIGMPFKDGLELCHTIKTTPGLEKIKVIILTAYGNDSAKVLGSWVKADEYMCKPIDMPKLLETVENYLSE